MASSRPNLGKGKSGGAQNLNESTTANDASLPQQNSHAGPPVMHRSLSAASSNDGNIPMLTPNFEHQTAFQIMDESERAHFYTNRRDALIEGIERAESLLRRLERFNTLQFPLNIISESDNTTSATDSASQTSSLEQPRRLSVLSLGPIHSAIDQNARAHILNERFTRALEQLNNLRSRITSSTSRILVTGDLNAGKSSVVNALLRHQNLLPTDQQPCTTAFCEVGDAHRLNHDREEVHAILEGQMEAYERREQGSYHVYPLSELYSLVASQEVQDEEEEQEAEQEQEVDEGIGEEIAVAEKRPDAGPSNRPHYAVVKAFIMPSKQPGGGDDDGGDDDNKNDGNNDNSVPLSHIPNIPKVDLKGKGKAKQNNDASEDEKETGFIHDSNSSHALSLIDSPGLNVSNIKTTSVFARQSEIDIVVFVVSAENHFTLSAEDFLHAASLEKPYIFIVVNKWSTIRNQRFAVQRIKEQIKRLSPDTYRLRHELVHFVDAESFLQQSLSSASAEPSSSTSSDKAFKHLESSLRSFVLLKRAQSKLSPSKTYLSKLHNDLSVLSQCNLALANEKRSTLSNKLDQVVPENDRLVATSNRVNDAVADVIESHVDSIYQNTWSLLEKSSQNISRGELHPESKRALPPFTSIFDLWNWSRHVLDTFVHSLEDDVRSAEMYARNHTSAGVDMISNNLHSTFLPNNDNEKNNSNLSSSTAAPRRLFQPNKMFRTRTHIGISAEKIELDITDLFDFTRLTNLFSNITNNKLLTNKAEESRDDVTTVVSLGAGGMIAAYAGKTLGVKALVNNMGRIMDILTSDTARRLVFPVFAAVGIAVVGFVIIDLPKAVPHNLGRKVHATLAAHEFSADNLQQQKQSFSTLQAHRISRLSRQVLTVSGDDLRTTFRLALESSSNERQQVEKEAATASTAVTWLTKFSNDVDEELSKVEKITLEEATV